MYAMFILNYYLCTDGHPDNVGDDCPVFDGLFEYCSISAGGSMGKCNLFRIMFLTFSY